jgi:Amt family ammonium transporter
VVGVHGVGGAWGALATGIFASVAVNAAGADGLIHGNAGQLGTQAMAIGATAGFSFVATLIILKVLDLVMGLRVSEAEEVEGLDVSQHGERAYALEGFAGVPMAQIVSQPASRPGRLTVKETGAT